MSDTFKIQCPIHKITLFETKDIDKLFEIDRIYCQLCQEMLNIVPDCKIIIEEVK